MILLAEFKYYSQTAIYSAQPDFIILY